MKTIDVLIGTRPEAIKMAPIVRRFSEQPWAKIRVIVTGQHSNLLNDALRSLGVQAHTNLEVMTPNQTLEGLTARLIVSLDKFWRDNQPDMVLGQGDTTTVLTGALVSYYKQIPFGHVEAGLRSGNLYSPFPEEMNRAVVGRLAALHFAPTRRAADALLAEGAPADIVHITGNTVIDELKETLAQTKPSEVGHGVRRQILLTTHRRENFGGPMAGILEVMRELVEARDDLVLLFPAHPNPAVRAAAVNVFGHHPRVRVVEPLDYPNFVAAMRDSYLIVTDSGGVQEEAPFIGRPVVVIRNETERPEALEYNVARLVGTAPDLLKSTLEELLDDPEAYRLMTRGASPYGDGLASARIVGLVGHHLGEVAKSDIPEMFLVS